MRINTTKNLDALCPPVRWWEDPSTWVREVRANFCPRCETTGHDLGEHFDRCQWDCAAVPELSALAVLPYLLR